MSRLRPAIVRPAELTVSKLQPHEQLLLCHAHQTCHSKLLIVLNLHHCGTGGPCINRDDRCLSVAQLGIQSQPFLNLTVCWHVHQRNWGKTPDITPSQVLLVLLVNAWSQQQIPAHEFLTLA